MEINKNDSMNENYINVIYDEKSKPLTDYPHKLTAHLIEKLNISKDSTLLDVGCGRGDFLNGFINSGCNGYGIDFTNAAEKYCPDAKLFQADIENNGMPFEDNYFDVIFSKSVIEHFYDPDILIRECKRCLKPGGMIIVMAPSWEYNYRIYFEDYTHRTPFMKTSMRDILEMHGFDKINVSFFKQLPILWGPWGYIFAPISYLTQILIPRFFSNKFKWVRFSKEIMLLGVATKSK
jgi:ubiquinone/menaquinone biosynthesis C-methylase UbiE